MSAIAGKPRTQETPGSAQRHNNGVDIQPRSRQAATSTIRVGRREPTSHAKRCSRRHRELRGTNVRLTPTSTEDPGQSKRLRLEEAYIPGRMPVIRNNYAVGGCSAHHGLLVAALFAHAGSRQHRTEPINRRGASAPDVARKRTAARQAPNHASPCVRPGSRGNARMPAAQTPSSRTLQPTKPTPEEHGGRNQREQPPAWNGHTPGNTYRRVNRAPQRTNRSRASSAVQTVRTSAHHPPDERREARRPSSDVNEGRRTVDRVAAGSETPLAVFCSIKKAGMVGRENEYGRNERQPPPRSQTRLSRQGGRTLSKRRNQTIRLFAPEQNEWMNRPPPARTRRPHREGCSSVHEERTEQHMATTGHNNRRWNIPSRHRNANQCSQREEPSKCSNLLRCRSSFHQSFRRQNRPHAANVMSPENIRFGKQGMFAARWWASSRQGALPVGCCITYMVGVRRASF